MRYIGPPIRTWPWCGSVNTAEPGPVHHASPVPVMRLLRWALTRRSPQASSAASAAIHGSALA
eukprot:13231332-Alexandrium_andersonii.AAC.1